MCSWLRESAELFLQNHTDIGNSAETAEDLLTEHQEFQIRAKVCVCVCMCMCMCMLYIVPSPGVSYERFSLPTVLL